LLIHLKWTLLLEGKDGLTFLKISWSPGGILMISENLYRILSDLWNIQIKWSCTLKAKGGCIISTFSQLHRSTIQFHHKCIFPSIATCSFVRFVSANLTDLQICPCICVKNITSKDIVVQIVAILLQRHSKSIRSITALRNKQFANFVN